MKVSFLGDLFLGGLLDKKDLENHIKLERLNHSDIVVGNLESPISNSNRFEDKSVLKSSAYAAQEIKKLGITSVSLANNHIHDLGREGFMETIQNLNKFDIEHFGAGSNLNSAGQPLKIDDHLFILAACDYAKPYLNKIKISDSTDWGIFPLKLEEIQKKLQKLDDKDRVILYLHWGMEHLNLPLYEDLILARKLLENEKVLMIIGSHAHRIQGVLEHNGKKAYMCLGNFIFPDFFMEPPRKISSKKRGEIPSYAITYSYHKVWRLTLKKWRLVNRASLIVNFDSNISQTQTDFIFQDKDNFMIKKPNGFLNFYFGFRFKVLSFIMRLPKFLYLPTQKVDQALVYLRWNSAIYFFHLKELGLKKFISEVFKKLNGKHKEL
mgnify:CR=1 FL=1|tara:strand:- start:18886 stop:20025 length:1140 start_codon:yes stop_codon:yes gene_type:complete